MKPSKRLIIIFRRNICALRVCVCDFLKHFDLNLFVPETSRKERKVMREKDFYLFLLPFFLYMCLYYYLGYYRTRR